MSPPLPPPLPSAPPPPPPPPPPPVSLKSTIANKKANANTGAATSALFAQIREKGDNIAAHLRHVDIPQKTFKTNVGNAISTSFTTGKTNADGDNKLCEKVTTCSHRSEVNKKELNAGNHQVAQTVQPTSVLQLEGDKRWIVRFQHGSVDEPIELYISECKMSHAVRIESCKNVSLQVSNKVNSVSILNCNKVQIALESVVSMVEVMKCNSVDVQINKLVPTITIEECSSVNLYFVDAASALTTEIVTACSTTVNVNVRKNDFCNAVKGNKLIAKTDNSNNRTIKNNNNNNDDSLSNDNDNSSDDEIIERAIPQQFVSRIVPDSRNVYKIETKPCTTS